MCCRISTAAQLPECDQWHVVRCMVEQWPWRVPGNILSLHYTLMLFIQSISIFENVRILGHRRRTSSAPRTPQYNCIWSSIMEQRLWHTKIPQCIYPCLGIFAMDWRQSINKSVCLSRGMETTYWAFSEACAENVGAKIPLLYAIIAINIWTRNLCFVDFMFVASQKTVYLYVNPPFRTNQLSSIQNRKTNIGCHHNVHISVCSQFGSGTCYEGSHPTCQRKWQVRLRHRCLNFQEWYNCSEKPQKYGDISMYNPRKWHISGVWKLFELTTKVRPKWLSIIIQLYAEHIYAILQTITDSPILRIHVGLYFLYGIKLNCAKMETPEMCAFENIHWLHC